MFKINYPEFEIKVKFHYHSGHNTGARARTYTNGKEVHTTCEVLFFRDGEVVDTKIGLAIRSPMDVFEKRKGRAIALYKALDLIDQRNIRKDIVTRYEKLCPEFGKMIRTRHQ